MGRKVIYWVATGLLALPAVFAGINYLRGSQQAVQAFAHVGYPQQLRVLLGRAKLLGGIALIVPGLLTLKEWAYAGFTFAWIAAVLCSITWRCSVSAAGLPVLEQPASMLGRALWRMVAYPPIPSLF